MLNYQPLIDNVHYIIAAVALLSWVWFQIVKYKSAKNPGIDWWDNQYERSKWALACVTEAIDWLDRSGHGKWKGADKLTEAVTRVKSFEALWEQGKHVEALAELAGFRQAALDKLQKAGASQLPFAPSPSPSITTQLPPAQTSVLLGAGNQQTESTTNSGIGSGAGDRARAAFEEIKNR